MRSLGRSSSFWLALVTSHFLASPGQVASHFFASPSQVTSHKNSDSSPTRVQVAWLESTPLPFDGPSFYIVAIVMSSALMAWPFPPWGLCSACSFFLGLMVRHTFLQWPTLPYALQVDLYAGQLTRGSLGWLPPVYMTPLSPAHWLEHVCALADPAPVTVGVVLGPVLNLSKSFQINCVKR